MQLLEDCLKILVLFPLLLQYQMHFANVTVILRQIELVPCVLWVGSVLHYVFRDGEENHLMKLGYI